LAKPTITPIKKTAVKPVIAPVTKTKPAAIPKPVIKPVVLPKVVKKEVVAPAPVAQVAAPVAAPAPAVTVAPIPPSVSHVELNSADIGKKGGEKAKAAEPAVTDVSPERLNAKW